MSIQRVMPVSASCITGAALTRRRELTAAFTRPEVVWVEAFKLFVCGFRSGCRPTCRRHTRAATTARLRQRHQSLPRLDLRHLAALDRRQAELGADFVDALDAAADIVAGDARGLARIG